MGQKKVSETTDIIRQNENLYLRKRRKCIVFFVYLSIQEILSLISYLSGSKIRINASMGELGIMCEGIYTRLTQELRKRWAYLCVCVGGGGGGAYRRRNTIFIDSLQPDVHEMTSQNFSILIQDLGVNSNGLFWRVYIC